MKRVSFKVAKALKQAGYPQELEEGEYSHSEWDSESKTFVQIPYATEVWLWLWREKKISLELYRYNRDNEWYVLCDNYREAPLKNDPEEAIIAAIEEYLVDNNLIK